MKKIAVFFKLPEAMDPPLATPDYWTAYSELTAEVSRLGGQLYIVRGQETYLGNGSFSKSWVIENDKLVETGPVNAAVIFDKGLFVSDNTVSVFNVPHLSKICNNKWLMFQTFPEFCPPTFFVTNLAELSTILPKITTTYTVFKPYTGAEGVGVKIEKKAYFKEHETELIFPAVVSEFLDTSSGISGIIEGTHDLRVAIFDGKILYSYVRTPPKGKLVANVSRGGTFTMINPKKIPQNVIHIVQTIDRSFSDIPHRFYGIDFGYTTEGPKIIEMNSELGLLPNIEGSVFKTLKEKLAQVFLDL